MAVCYPLPASVLYASFGGVGVFVAILGGVGIFTGVTFTLNAAFAMVLLRPPTHHP